MNSCNSTTTRSVQMLEEVELSISSVITAETYSTSSRQQQEEVRLNECHYVLSYCVCVCVWLLFWRVSLQTVVERQRCKSGVERFSCFSLFLVLSVFSSFCL